MNRRIFNKIVKEYLMESTKTDSYMLGSRGEELRYIKHNSERYFQALNMVSFFGKKIRGRVSLLDIGTSPLSFIIRSLYPLWHIFSVDYNRDFDKKSRAKGIKFRQLDLSKNFTLGKNRFDIILYLEVIEHLRAGHERSLRLLVDSLKKGGILILQTPNNRSLKSLTLKVLTQNVWGKVTNAPSTSGHLRHFREFSLAELVRILNLQEGIKIISARHEMYFDAPSSTLVYRKNPTLLAPFVYLNLFIVSIFPFLRRGMQIAIKKISS